MKTVIWENMKDDEFYNLAKEKYCAEFDAKDEGIDGEVYFTRDGIHVDYREFISFLRGFEGATACVVSGELVFPDKE